MQPARARQCPPQTRVAGLAATVRTDVKRPLSPPEVPPISVPGHVVHLQPGLVTTIADAPDTAPPPQSG
jgi:hypothetical protein